MRLRLWVIRLISITAALLCFFAVLGFCRISVEDVLCSITVMSVKTYLPVKDYYYEVEKNEESEAVSETVTASKQNQELKSPVSEADELTETPSDIAKAMKNAQKNSSKDKKDGSIYEYTFVSDGVTDSFGNVKVKNSNKTQISIEKKLKEKMELTVEKSKPAVLIYHTHTTETYQLLDRDFYARGFLSRSNDVNLNMVRVGKAICEEIEKQGYKVIHDTAIYDNPYTGAYYRSEDAARALLEKYPSIRITLDIHRDAIQNNSGVKTKPVAEINGKKAAQIMLVTGCQEEGNGITDLPEWEKNLTFALKLQQNMETMFPALTRPVYFCARSYNMGLTPYSLLVEMGSDANTLDEAVYSGKMLGRALAEILKEYEVA